MDNKRKKSCSGFTLVELLVAMMVTSIILSAIDSLAYAISYASSGASDIASKQARLRSTKVRINELIRNSKMICASNGTDIAIWRADDDDDNEIDTDEIVYIDGDAGDSIKILNFVNQAGSSITIAQLDSGAIKNWLISNVLSSEMLLIQDCDNISIAFDAAPPHARFASIAFELTGPDNIYKYEINSKMLCDPDHLLDSSDALIGTDDDD